jgi:ATP-dependent protease ClpP protease subunit
MGYIEKGNLLIDINRKRMILHGNILPKEQEAISTTLICLQGEDIQFFIDSGGGCFPSSLFIFDAIRLHGKVTGIVTAEANSGAFIAFQACSTRLMYPMSVTMGHSPTVASNMRTDQEDLMRKIKENLDKYYQFLKFLSKKTRIKLSTLKKWSKEEKRFTAQGALRYGLADKIISTMPHIKK